ncbi:hypothetical protein [Comamonas fluminis]|uniref:phage tail tube protein n=1 Tax=Comamonas fluminis TaxID=2796366 RepID=UPI001C454226|nr:hypothetical protein [Comamonas fluminis]
MSKTVETYFYGQGRVFSRPFGSVGNSGWGWWGDVSALTFGGTDETASHKESYSGQKSEVRSFSIGGECTIKLTAHQIDPDKLAQHLRGTITEIAAGSVTGELFPNPVAVGDVIKLDKPYNVSELVITDSSGAPVTLDPEHYDAFLEHGSIELLSLPTAPGLTQPFKAAYKQAGARQVAFFNAAPKLIQLRYEGINLTEDNAPVIAEWYKVSTTPLQELPFIASGNDLAGISIDAKCLADPTRPASGPFGRFGRYVAINAIQP